MKKNWRKERQTVKRLLKGVHYEHSYVQGVRDGSVYLVRGRKRLLPELRQC